MPLQQTSGNVTSDAFGGGVAAEVNYIESVFSTYLYTGTGASQTITNGIDLSTKGGLVWIKGRSGATDHRLTDTARGVTKSLASNSSAGEATETTGLTAFGTTGFTIGADADYNTSADTYASWSFRKQPKFFDIQTWSGDSTARTIAHNLGSVPGCIMVKRIDATAQNWNVYHQSLGNEFRIALDTTSAAVNIGNACWNSTTPTSTVFSLGTNSGVNASGGTYEAYLFAHDAGGFGLTGTDNVVSCGGFTADGAGAATVNLGYEPQWLLVKRTSSATDWQLYDNMRGFTVDNVGQLALRPNTSTAESAAYPYAVNATGFSLTGVGAGNTFVYIAIRRGPMKVPTDATKVFNSVARTGTSVATTVSTGIIQDLTLIQQRSDPAGSGSVSKAWWYDRLRGGQPAAFLTSSGTDAEGANSGMLTSIGMNTYNLGSDPGNQGINVASNPTINWNFRRAPGFFDEVCYTGTGSNLTLPHNLTVAPELVIAKVRSTGSSWGVSTSADWTKYLLLNSTNAQASASLFGTPDATNFYPTASGGFSGSGNTYVAYLFATCAGVSKVGSYTGTGATQTISCGFTGGARFVLVKRTDSTGDWYVYDTARGMTVLTDPYLLLNSAAAETATLGSVTTVSTGFALNSSILADINISAGTYIFLAIA